MKVCSNAVSGLLGTVVLGCSALCAVAGGLQPLGLEFPLTRGIPGDQVNPSMVFGPSGGLILWQDAAIDGHGLGIAALRLGADGKGVGSPRRVNEAVSGEQENPFITSFADGRSLCLWQGGQVGFQRIVGRILSADGTPLGADIPISVGDGEHQVDPVAVVLRDGSAVVAWASYRQEGSSSYDVFARRISSSGEFLGAEFRLNGTQGLNRRSPALAPLQSGGFLGVWVQERQVGVRDNSDSIGRSLAGYGAPVFSVQIVARGFDGEGSPINNEVGISESGMSANPVVTALPDGGIFAAWTRRSPSDRQVRYDVYGRMLNGFGLPANGERLINIQTTGDQFRPRLAVTSYGVMAVWTSMGQDGSWEGVFGRWVSAVGEPSGDEIAINTQAGGGQIFPALAPSDGSSFLVAYSSNQPRSGYELFAQRLAPLLLKVRSGVSGQLRLQWQTVSGGVYQLQSSVDAKVWRNIGSTRTASGEIDELAITAPGQMVLYRIVRVR